MSPRLRFAPSPTGNLHLGGARTALFNFLYARHTGGKFLLRIEDTDRERSTDESREAIIEGLKWLGMEADEPALIQSQRLDDHVAAVNQLLDTGNAYRCTCTAEEVEQMREAARAEGKKPRYNGHCRELNIGPDSDKPFTVRLKMPVEGKTLIQDIVLGDVEIDNDELDDLILLRSDGNPTYNMVVVVDDAHMKVSHVVRGQDHMTNTLRQVHIYKALGLTPPKFAHLPLIDGLSKRKGSASVLDYRDQGFLPEAINNYIARLGWSHGDQEIFSPEELIELFDLDDVNKSSGSFDQVKLAWVNQQWIRRLDTKELASRMPPYLSKLGIEAEVDDSLVALTAALQERSNSLLEIADGMVFAFKAPQEWDPAGVKKWMKPAVLPAYDALIEAFEALSEWEASNLDAAVKKVAAKFELGLGKVAQPIRVALTGRPVSPPIDETLALVGREAAIERMRAARHLLEPR